MKIILLPILLPIWAFQLMFWVCFLPLIILMKLFGSKVSLAPSLVGLSKNNNYSSSSGSGAGGLGTTWGDKR
jgi:hypothetical protein